MRQANIGGPDPAPGASASPLFTYVLGLADDALVLGHRLSEWSGRGPTLEEDIALSNLALDLIGQARFYYAYAGELEGQGRDEDALAYWRDEHAYRNLLLRHYGRAAEVARPILHRVKFMEWTGKTHELIRLILPLSDDNQTVNMLLMVSVFGDELDKERASEPPSGS